MTNMIEIKAGERKKVLSRKFSSVPMEYEFSVKSVDGQALSGTVEVEMTKTIFRNESLKFPLQAQHIIKATLWDTFMDVYVTADTDVQIEMPKRSMNAKPVIIGLILVVVALASVIMMLSFNQ